MILLFALVGCVIVAVIVTVSLYNSLVGQRNRTRNAWSQIDVQLKRRYDLIPNLVETAKGYLKHERETLEAVMTARNQAMSLSRQAPNAQAVQAAQQFEGALGRLMAVVESYPDLKADAAMRGVAEELTSTENRIGFARQAYNDAATDYRNACEIFPASLLAGVFRFEPLPLWQIEDAREKAAVNVRF